MAGLLAVERLASPPPTACVDVMPTPLSSTSQPLTSRFFGRSPCGRWGGRGGVSLIISRSGMAGERPQSQVPAAIARIRTRAEPFAAT